MSDSSFFKFPLKLHIAEHSSAKNDPPAPTSAFLTRTFQQVNLTLTSPKYSYKHILLP